MRAVTKASASCGSCTGLVEQVLALTLGGAYAAPAAKPMCKCTDFSHEDVRRLIVAKELKSMPAVMQELGWKTSGGCHVCRPALNFYLLADWPDEYRDDAQRASSMSAPTPTSRRTAPFRWCPRMWGGVTTPAELRAIADAAEKYDVPMVKVTGGQRLDLLGVRKEDLPAIWGDLNNAGLVSGHAYAKGLRTVKTCVGSEFCRFGTQDSTGLGIKLEKRLWGSWTPHKVKIGVSGCPRNCAEATCKDVGIVCVDSGYQIGVGGAAGMDVKATELLAAVPTEAEAIEIVTAFVQLYRENAKYLDRPYKWIAKVGLDWVKARVVGRPRQPRRARRPLRAQPAHLPDRPLGADAPKAPSATSSPRWRPAREGGSRMNALTESGSISAPSTTSRPRRPGGEAPRAAASPSSAPPRTRSSPSTTAARTRAARSPRASCTAASVTCPLHNWVISLETGRRRAPTRAGSAATRCASPTAACCSAPPLATDPVTAVRTTCPYCGVGCGILATPDGRGGADHRRRPRPPSQLRPALLQGRRPRRDTGARGPAARTPQSTAGTPTGTPRSS